MKGQRLKLGVLLTAVAVFGVYWAVRAQERPSGQSTPIAETRAPASARFPNQTQPLVKKKKTDPLPIVPPEVYDVPRSITAPVEIKVGGSGVVQAGAQLPPPMFPTNPVEVKEGPKELYPPPLPPVVDPKVLIAPPMPEPTKALIIDAPKKTMEEEKGAFAIPAAEAKKADVPAPLQLDAKKDVVVPPLDPPEKKGLLIAPPMIEPPAKKVAFIPPPLKDEPTKKVLVIPPPLDEPKKDLVVPSGFDLPPPRKDDTPPLTVRVAPTEPTLKSFVRIRPNPGVDDLRGPNVPVKLDVSRTLDKLPPLNATPGGGSLVNLQTPSIMIEKRGAATLRAGETQAYQIIVRNLGPTPAQQIRVEDELPAGVRLMTADPAPQMHGASAAWLITTLGPGSEQTLHLTLRADANVQLANNTSVHVSAANRATRVASAPPPAPASFAVRVSGPERVNVGKPVTFDIHVRNSGARPLTDIVLQADLPAGLVMQVKDELGMLREERRIEGPVTGMAIAPGETKILKMPVTAAKVGRHAVNVTVATAQGEMAATTEIEIAADTLVLEQTPTTHGTPGRDVDLRIEMANHTGKPLRNVQVATVLPEGFTFLGASDRGLYSANTRTAYWLFDMMPVGVSKTLIVRVNTTKTGQFQHVVSAKADGLAESRSTSSIVLEGVADLALRVNNRDSQLEVGRETVYEIQVQNNGSAPASNIRLQVQFPPGLAPKNAQGNSRFALDRQSVTFEPITTLGPQGQTIFRVAAQAQSAGRDQRVRFAVVSDETKTPVQRELSVMVYSGN